MRSSNIIQTEKPPRLAGKKLFRRRFVEFPGIRNRTVEKVELFTTPEHHVVTVTFQDKSVLNLGVVPGFKLRARLISVKSGNARVIKSWPVISSASEVS